MNPMFTWKPRWLLALPLVLAASIGTARAATIRDNANLFDPAAVREAEAQLDRAERDTKMTVTIETIDSLQGRSIEDASLRHAQASGTHGIYVLIARDEKKLRVRVSKSFERAFPDSRLETVLNAFTSGFKRGDYTTGLKQGVQALVEQIEEAKAENGGTLRGTFPAAGAAPLRGRPMARQARPFGIGSLLGIVLAIVAILFVFRLLGSLFGGGPRGPARMGGPGYGAPGYGGGGGGGFMSSLFGGLGGALAGNWLYDQFSGRHQGGGYADNSSYSDGGQDVSGGAGGDDWAGGGGVSGDWGGGDGGGGGGGDWGGGGGGDWGGGGGGGGGDW